MSDQQQAGLARAKKQQAQARLQAGDLSQARLFYSEACTLDPTDAEAWCMLGSINGQLGLAGEAEDCFGTALNIDPDYGMAHQYLANHLTSQGRYAEAVAAYRRALRIKPTSIPANVNLATALVLQGKLDAALESYQEALRLDPGCRKAVLGIAHVHERQGKVQEAMALIQPYLDAGDRGAEVAMVFAALCRPLKRCDEAIALLERALAAGGTALDDGERTALHFRLGRLYDANNDFDAAFKHCALGNDIKARRWPFDRLAHGAYIDGLIEGFSRSFMARAPRAAHGSQRPVFIVGMPRSGTSLVEQILASHPSVFGAGELDEISRIAADLPSVSAVQDPYPRAINSLTPSACEQLARRYLEYLDAVAPGDALRVTDKMPTNFLHLGLIALLFPEAHVIHCIRDPLDTCLSCYFQNFGPGLSFSYDLTQLGNYYRDYQRLMEHWRAVLALTLLEVRYEELVANQEQISRQVVAFCGLKWDDRCLRFYETPRQATTASYDQVRQPLYNRSVGRWRRYAAHLGPLQRALEGHSADDGLY
jgi:tetratricopeptide (TPR) repeat protein